LSCVMLHCTNYAMQGHGESYWLGAKHCGSDEVAGVLLRLIFKYYNGEIIAISTLVVC